MTTGKKPKGLKITAPQADGRDLPKPGRVTKPSRWKPLPGQLAFDFGKLEGEKRST